MKQPLTFLEKNAVTKTPRVCNLFESKGFQLWYCIECEKLEVGINWSIGELTNTKAAVLRLKLQQRKRPKKSSLERVSIECRKTKTKVGRSKRTETIQ